MSSQFLARSISLALLICALGPVLLHAGEAPAKAGSILFAFDYSDGAAPQDGLVADSHGNLFGTTYLGGNGECDLGCGVVFELSHTGTGWVENTIYYFCSQAYCADGTNPYAGVTVDKDGNLYGTTFQNGYYGAGTVYELSPDGHGGYNFQVLYNFAGGSDGSNPLKGRLALDASGNLYGTTYRGGASDNGTVYEVSRSGSTWKETVLYSFTLGADGGWPNGGVVLDKSGNLFGASYFGGVNNCFEGCGSVYELTHSGSTWVETTLHEFQGGNNDGGADGTDLTLDAEGNIYGATFDGGGTGCGGDGCGVVFELSNTGSGWSEKILHSFSGTNDGQGPVTVSFDAKGNLLGATQGGGLQNCSSYAAPSSGGQACGVVYKLTPQQNGSWTETILHDFTGGADGGEVFGNLLVSPSGAVFGMSYWGGANGYGSVWEGHE